MDYLRLYYKKTAVIGSISFLLLFMVFFFNNEIFEYYSADIQLGTLEYRKTKAFIGCTYLGFATVAIPKGIEFFRLTLDMIFRKQKSIIVIGVKKPHIVDGWSPLRYVLWKAKDTSNHIHTFKVLDDVYSLKAKKVDNTYMVTYFVFSKLVTKIEKHKKSDLNQSGNGSKPLKK